MARTRRTSTPEFILHMVRLFERGSFNQIKKQDFYI